VVDPLETHAPRGLIGFLHLLSQVEKKAGALRSKLFAAGTAVSDYVTGLLAGEKPFSYAVSSGQVVNKWVLKPRPVGEFNQTGV
jgi:hypothetical protein